MDLPNYNGKLLGCSIQDLSLSVERIESLINYTRNQNIVLEAKYLELY